LQKKLRKTLGLFDVAMVGGESGCFSTSMMGGGDLGI